MITSDRIRTLSKSFFFVKEEDDAFFVGNDNAYAQIVATNVLARNGVIHVIDAVMLP